MSTSATSYLFVFLALVSLCHAATFLSDTPIDGDFNFTQIANALKYPVEQHDIKTQDGYILTFFRIQAKHSKIRKNLPVAYFQHGLLDSCESSVINTEDQSPALILANQGYDVWIGNGRGNKYSLKHSDTVHYNSSDLHSKFWDFSWQEMSLYDIPAALEYISLKTNQKVNYIGHSEGTTIMFAALARRDPTVLKYMKKFIALAPAIFLQHSTSPIIQVAGLLRLGIVIKEIIPFLKDKTFGFRTPEQQEQLEKICKVSVQVCIQELKLICDTNTTIDNIDRLPIILPHYPSGSSLQNMLYWGQMFDQKEFRMYDFGKIKNYQVYGSLTPPVYNLGLIEEPIYIFAGLYDELATLKDTTHLVSRLTSSSKVEFKTYPLGHATFLWGLNVTGYFDDVLKALKD